MYNDDKYSCYTRRRIIIKYLMSLYKKMYNTNKYSCYTRRRITQTNILVIQEDV